MTDTKITREQIETTARRFHEIYQEEARRQGDVRHPDDYYELPENIKEFDRVLARYHLQAIEERDEQIQLLQDRVDHFCEAMDERDEQIKELKGDLSVANLQLKARQHT